MLASDQQTWPLVTIQARFCHRIKKSKNSICDLFISQFRFLLLEMTSCNSDFLRIERYCKFTITKKKMK